MRSKAQRTADIEQTIALYGWDDVPVKVEHDCKDTDCPAPLPGQVWTDGLTDWQIVTVDRLRKLAAVVGIGFAPKRVGLRDEELAAHPELVDGDWRLDKALVDGRGAPWRPTH